MALRGKKPEPNSRRSVAKVSPAGSGVAVSPQRELTGEAARAWEIVVNDLNEQKIFAPSDSLLLTTFCELYGFSVAEKERMDDILLRLEEASAKLDALNVMDYDDEESFEKARGILERREERLSLGLKRARNAYMGYVKEMRAFASEFAISPVARTRMGLTQLQSVSLGAALEKLFSEGEEDPPEPGFPGTVIEGEVL
jgi:phage terminase small subunit